jgi:hypothetical protein
MRRWFRNRLASDFPLGLPLILTLIVVLPTVAMLWLVGEATQNEHLAVRQRLIDVYRDQLNLLRQQIGANWTSRLAELERLANNDPPRLAFAACVK